MRLRIQNAARRALLALAARALSARANSVRDVGQSPGDLPLGAGLLLMGLASAAGAAFVVAAWDYSYANMPARHHFIVLASSLMGLVLTAAGAKTLWAQSGDPEALARRADMARGQAVALPERDALAGSLSNPTARRPNPPSKRL